MKPIRIGAISFLNAKPIFYGLELNGHSQFVTLNTHLPAENVEYLNAGELDVGLIPSIEYARNDDLCIVPGVAIGSDGPVASVKLFSTVPVEKIKSIAVDERSRTSTTMLRILCAEHFNITPEFVPAAPDEDAMLKHYDAAMIFGDEALYINKPEADVIDLGAEWKAFSSYPFIYAFLAGHPGAVDPEHVILIRHSLSLGLNNLRKIASNHPSPCRPDAAELNKKYLEENISYQFGERELDGLKLFYIKAWEHGIIDGVPRIRFYPE